VSEGNAAPLAPLPDDWSRALAVVAHPDDLEYGASSAVARWTSEGKEVVYLLATRGEAGIDALPPERCGPLREAEERAAAEVVGVRTVEFLGYQDGLLEWGIPLRRDLARAIRRHRPEVVITSNFAESWPGGPLNQADHRAIGLAACDAVRDAGNRWIFPDLLEEGHTPWNGCTRVFVNADPAGQHAVDVSEYLERGVASLQAHAAYLAHIGPSFDPARFLREAAEGAGRALGCRYAVSFRLLQV
jgi:LmbE family N-acetylglucosaminyl deacetylase